MSIFEDNIYVLKQTHNYLCEAVMSEKNTDSIQVGQALNGEKFLAVEQNASWISLDSIYNPSHAARQFTEQFTSGIEELNLVVFGFGSGKIIRQILQSRLHVNKCIILEPSLNIFCISLAEYDLQEILSDSRIQLFIEGVNADQLSAYLDDVIQHNNWKNYQYVVLPKYSELFRQKEQNCFGLYKQILVERSNNQSFFKKFAARLLDNEAHAMQWLIRGKSSFELKQYISPEVPCIIVASGPSLEKNAEELKRAKGRSVILAVDSSLYYLSQKEIIPDLICTVDPEASDYVKISVLNDSPVSILAPTSADYHMIASVPHAEILCCSADNEYHRSLLSRYGWDIPYIYGGTSVATMCCEWSIQVGFRTIILVGQDLALQGEIVHAGIHKGTKEYNKLDSKIMKRIHAVDVEEGHKGRSTLLVDGYYGGKVSTLPDFKMFLEWYQRTIAQHRDIRFINATEGGARICGAVQMRLSEAVDQYCKISFSLADICQKLPCLWPDERTRSAVIQELAQQGDMIDVLSRSVEQMLQMYQTYKGKMNREQQIPLDMDDINHAAQKVMHELAASPVAMLLYKRVIMMENDLRDRLHRQNRGIDFDKDESLDFMISYFLEIRSGLEEMRTYWTELLQNIEPVLRKTE